MTVCSLYLFAFTVSFVLGDSGRWNSRLETLDDDLFDMHVCQGGFFSRASAADFRGGDSDCGRKDTA